MTVGNTSREPPVRPVGPDPVATVSLVVCTTGDPALVERLSERLAAVCEASGTAVQAIVVDNSASGGVRLDDRVRVVHAPLRGLSRARAVGCLHATADVVVFTDDDVDFAPDWPLRMAQPILDGRADAVGAPVRLGPAFANLTWGLARAWLAEANLSGEPILVGAGMAFRREALDVAAWDPRIGAGMADYPFGEETLFEAMLREAGGRIAVAEDAGVTHHPDPSRAEPEALRATAYGKGMSNAYAGYHWYGESMPHPRLRAARRRVRLWLHRRRSGALDRELELIQDVGVAMGFARESALPRAYVPRGRATLPPSPPGHRRPHRDGPEAAPEHGTQ